MFTEGTRRLGSAARSAARFTTRPSSPTPFGLLRIGTALCFLAKAWAEYGSLLDLYGNRGLVQWCVSDAVIDGWVPRLSLLAGLLRGYGVDENGCAYLVFYAYVFSLLGLLVGWQTRITAGLAWLAHLTLHGSGHLTAYGVDDFAKIALFYCVLMPTGASLSVARLTGRLSGEPTPSATLFLRLLQLHLCVVYLTAGLAKAQGTQWWNGEAIWRALMQPQFRAFDMEWLARVPWLAMAACWGTLLIEVGYALFIWPRRTRWVWLGATVGL